MADLKSMATAKLKGAEEEKWRNSSVYTEIMVSSFGRVKERGYQKVVKDNDGSFRIYEIPAKSIPTHINSAGNVSVSFNSSKGWSTEEVGYLVATEFVANEDPVHYTKIKYLDGNRANVKASNMMWNGTGIYSK